MGFSGGSDGKESAWNVGDLGSIPGLGRFSGGGHGNPLQYSYLENPHGQRSLEGYSPWGRKELDMTEWLSTHTQHNYRYLGFCSNYLFAEEYLITHSSFLLDSEDQMFRVNVSWTAFESPRPVVVFMGWELLLLATDLKTFDESIWFLETWL